MKGDKYTKSLAKNQVSAIFHMRDIRGKHLLQFMKLCMETRYWCPLWPPELTNRNICLWVFLQIREFIAEGSH